MVELKVVDNEEDDDNIELLPKSTITQRTSMTRSALFFFSASLALATANAAATGADATCDAALDAHNSIFSTDCVAVSGTCPASCLASFEALESSCAGKKYSDTQTIDGVSVEVALDWNTDKGAYLQSYQGIKNLFGDDDECCEVIHDYQLTHINDCDEAYNNIIWDLMFGYYCDKPKSTDTICAPECQESIDKLESVCNPTGGPIGTLTTTADDDVTTIQETYSWVHMAVADFFGPDSCTYKTSLSSANTAAPAMVIISALVGALVFLVASITSCAYCCKCCCFRPRPAVLAVAVQQPTFIQQPIPVVAHGTPVQHHTSIQMSSTPPSKETSEQKSTPVKAFCPKCGAAVAGAAFCPSCGQNQ